MKTIGIETSGTTGSVGACSGGARLERVFTEGLGHGKLLAAGLSELLAELGWRLGDLDLIALNLGPGSYTGLRIGSAFAKALAFAEKKPLVGVSGFQAMAAHAPGTETFVAPLLDARWGQVYAAVFERAGSAPQRIVPDSVGPPEKIIALAPEGTLFFGPGARKYRDQVLERGRCADEGPWDRPRADEIAALGARLYAEKGAPAAELIEPLYLRRTQAEDGREGRGGGA